MKIGDNYGVAFLEQGSPRTNEKTGETYNFQINSAITVHKGGSKGNAYTALVCNRGGQTVTVFQYSIGAMNCFSLVAFLEQYKHLMWNWTYDCEISTLIRTCEEAFRTGPGPVIRVNGKFIDGQPGTDIEVVK